MTGPTTSSFDCVYRISPAGQVERFFTGVGRPQGLAVDIEGALYVVASYRGRRGILRFKSDATPNRSSRASIWSASRSTSTTT